MRSRHRSLLIEAIFIAGVVGAFALMAMTAHSNLASQHIANGFDFLFAPTGWDVGSSLIPHSSVDPYWRTFLVGIINTIVLSIISILGASLLGVVLGALAASPNPLIRGGILAYVNGFRNIPIIVQVFFWYSLTRQLPPVRQAISLLGIGYLSNRGLYLPSIGLHGLDLHVTWPELKGFDFQGGVQLTPEFVALATAIVLYNTAFIAEIIRGSIRAVPKGQIEAAHSLALPRWLIFIQVTLPQALRIMIPPLTSQFISIAKSTSLAVAIGYSELFSVATVTINNTGQSIENIAILMAVYMVVSAVLSGVGESAARVFQWPGSR